MLITWSIFNSGVWKMLLVLTIIVASICDGWENRPYENKFQWLE